MLTLWQLLEVRVRPGRVSRDAADAGKYREQAGGVCGPLNYNRRSVHFLTFCFCRYISLVESLPAAFVEEAEKTKEKERRQVINRLDT